MVNRQTELAAFAFEQQQFIEIKQGIGKKCIVFKIIKVLCEFYHIFPYWIVAFIRKIEDNFAWFFKVIQAC